MKVYKITFEGRTLGAIGIFQQFTETVEADSFKAAVLKLYDHYENVHMPYIMAEDGATYGKRIYLSSEEGDNA